MFKKKNFILYLFVFIQLLKMAESHENPIHVIFILCVLLILANIANKLINGDNEKGSSLSNKDIKDDIVNGLSPSVDNE